MQKHHIPLLVSIAIYVMGCHSAPSEPERHHAGINYQGYAVKALWSDSLHRFIRVQPVTDSATSQIRITATGPEMKATVSITGELHPLDVFLFESGGYATGNDQASFAYFSADSLYLTWGRLSDSVAVFAKQ